MAAVYLYATRLNYVSPDLEWLANAYVAKMKMKIELQGNSTFWTSETRAKLEAEIRHAFFDSKAKADTLLGKGVVRPLFDPDKVRLMKFFRFVISHLANSKDPKGLITGLSLRRVAMWAGISCKREFLSKCLLMGPALGICPRNPPGIFPEMLPGTDVLGGQEWKSA